MPTREIDTDPALGMHFDVSNWTRINTPSGGGSRSHRISNQIGFSNHFLRGIESSESNIQYCKKILLHHVASFCRQTLSSQRRLRSCGWSKLISPKVPNELYISAHTIFWSIGFVCPYLYIITSNRSSKHRPPMDTNLRSIAHASMDTKG